MKFILVRHGKPTYEGIKELGFSGHGIALAPLTKKGIEEVKQTAENKIFEGCDLLISSPYTRTMQTASIISNKYNLDINVELLLHEWIPDLTNTYNSEKQFLKNIRIAKKEWEEYQINPNIIFNDKIESLKNVRNRALRALEKYTDNKKVIVVSHGLLISMLFKEKVRLKTGEFICITSEELEENFEFYPKTKTLI